MLRLRLLCILAFVITNFSSLVAAQIINSNITGIVKGSLVDLGYSQYQGYVDHDTDLEYFLGIRFASTPARWQAPVKPTVNRTETIQANKYGSQCYQASESGSLNSDFTGSEDCLFLNVWRPSNTTEVLPVLVWIHGGGYTTGNGRADPTVLQQVTSSRFIFVSIQYRLGAFGFLASSEVKQHGALNAGLLDQNRALNWIQEHISTFGGDPDQVTIFGASAGAGSVMQHLLSYGGSLGSTLFTKAMMASPFIPKQYRYDDAVPGKFYNLFAKAAGCDFPIHDYAGVFACLSLSDTLVLANASRAANSQAFAGSAAFAPVTDGIFCQSSPSVQLASGKLNGMAVLVGNNGLEGNMFVPTNITSSEDFATYARTYLPELNAFGLKKLMLYYPEPEMSGGLYSTQYARASQFLGDSRFNCPGNWIADAFESSYRYSYAVPNSYHGLDLPNYLPSVAAGAVYPSSFLSFSRIFDTALVSFVMDGVPSFKNLSNTSFSRWSSSAHGSQVILNVSNAAIIPFSYSGFKFNLTIGGSPSITVANGSFLTNGLDRCDYWRSIAPVVPL